MVCCFGLGDLQSAIETEEPYIVSIEEDLDRRLCLGAVGNILGTVLLTF